MIARSPAQTIIKITRLGSKPRRRPPQRSDLPSIAARLFTEMRQPITLRKLMLMSKPFSTPSPLNVRDMCGLFDAFGLNALVTVDTIAPARNPSYHATRLFWFGCSGRTSSERKQSLDICDLESLGLRSYGPHLVLAMKKDRMQITCLNAQEIGTAVGGKGFILDPQNDRQAAEQRGWRVSMSLSLMYKDEYLGLVEFGLPDPAGGLRHGPLAPSAAYMAVRAELQGPLQQLSNGAGVAPEETRRHLGEALAALTSRGLCLRDGQLPVSTTFIMVWGRLPTGGDHRFSGGRSHRGDGHVRVGGGRGHRATTVTSAP